jgi:RNA-directed DNA polymerase
MKSVSAFITKKLKLKINAQKSAVAKPWERKFLGFSFTNEPKPRRLIAPKALERFKERIRELTRRTRGVSFAQMAKGVARYLNGWKAYFGFCELPSVLSGLDGWIRRRLRSVVWKQWKHFPRRCAELRRRGVPHQRAAQLASSGKGPWRIAQNPTLLQALPTRWFHRWIPTLGEVRA